MTSSSPLIQRLQTHQANTRRMLVPGLKDSARQQPSLAPVLDAWGSQKYAAFAQNMRFLSKERLGHLTPEKINLFSRNLSARFSEPANLLHIHPATTKKNSIWPDVEKILPTGVRQAGTDAQAPPHPGTLRQGSVIQRFQTVPRPGQSFESFKEQIQSRAALPKPASSPPLRPRPKPGEPVRRYSRIEEITGKESPALTEPPAQPPDTVQRQMEPAPSLKPNADEPLLQTSKPAAELRRQAMDLPSAEPIRADSPDKPQPEQAVIQAAKPDTLPAVELPNAVTPDRPDSPPALAMPVKALPARTQAQKRALPKREAPSATLKLAQPVARNQTQASRKPEAQLPPALPTPQESAAAPKPPSLSPSTSRPEQAATRFAQSAPRASTPLDAATFHRQEQAHRQEEAHRQEQPGAVSHPQQFFVPEAASPAVRIQTPASAETRPPSPLPPEAPLLLRLTRRKAAPEQIRFVTPKLVRPEAQPAALIQRDLPPIGRRQPVPPPSMPERDKALPARPPAQPAADAGATALRLVGQGSAPLTAKSQVEMPVAHAGPRVSPPGRFAPPVDLPPTTLLPPAENNQPQPPAPPPPAAVSSAAANVVQRLWKGHSPPASQSGGSAARTASGSGEEPTDGLDLDALAEQVFPMIKRLLEIESERSSGYLR